MISKTVSENKPSQSSFKCKLNEAKLVLIWRKCSPAVKKIYFSGPVETRMGRRTSARKLGEGLTKDQKSEDIHAIVNIKQRSKYEDVVLPDVQV